VQAEVGWCGFVGTGVGGGVQAGEIGVLVGGLRSTTALLMYMADISKQIRGMAQPPDYAVTLTTPC
jgi:hypothetical protein